MKRKKKIGRAEGALPAFTFDTYFSDADGVPVVHVCTEGLAETKRGPVCRVYLNDGAALFANPPLPDTDKNGSAFSAAKAALDWLQSDAAKAGKRAPAKLLRSLLAATDCDVGMGTLAEEDPEAIPAEEKLRDGVRLVRGVFNTWQSFKPVSPESMHALDQWARLADEDAYYENDGKGGA